MKDLFFINLSTIKCLIIISQFHHFVLKGFGCWNVCPEGHISSVLHNLKDPPREVIVPHTHTQYQKPASACAHRQRNITSASGRLHEVQSTLSTVTKPFKTTCKSARSTSRCTSRSSSRASSSSTMEEKESAIWSDPPPSYPIDYKFKHSKHSKQHADTYR